MTSTTPTLLPPTSVLRFAAASVVLFLANAANFGTLGALFISNWKPYLPTALIASAVMLVVCLALEWKRTLDGWLDRPLIAVPSPIASGLAYWLAGLGIPYGKESLDRRREQNEKKKKEKEKAKAKSIQDYVGTARDGAETVVFVVVLVLMMKLFVVDAYVIPTGSMAETLFGFKKLVTCGECGHDFEVNASRESEATGSEANASTAIGYCCPNCRYASPRGVPKSVGISTGDRVLVSKFLTASERGQVVVFKYPVEPQRAMVSMNYIKRLIGLGGETIAVHGGDLYVATSLKYDSSAVDETGRPKYPLPKDANDLWRANSYPDDDYAYPSADVALALFDRSKADGFVADDGFRLWRKPDDIFLAMRRIVYDNDLQSRKLAEAGAPARWSAPKDDATAWSVDDRKMPKAFVHVGTGSHWIRYQHLLPANVSESRPPHGWTEATKSLVPRRITNFIGYNSGIYDGRESLEHFSDSDNWVGDLMVECEAKIEAETGAVALELSKGTHRYRAEFAGGKVRLKMFPGTIDRPRGDGNTQPEPNRPAIGGEEFTFATAKAELKPGKHTLALANADARLRVWVDGKPIDFGGKADYPPPAPPISYQPEDGRKEGWTQTNDIDKPAGIAVDGKGEISKIKLWRDNFHINNRIIGTGDPRMSRPRRADLDTFYVQPGHYLCMGDNSAQSSDGRMWGQVPERLMLGRAFFVFWPLDRIGTIR